MIDLRLETDVKILGQVRFKKYGYLGNFNFLIKSNSRIGIYDRFPIRKDVFIFSTLFEILKVCGPLKRQFT